MQTTHIQLCGPIEVIMNEIHSNTPRTMLQQEVIPSSMSIWIIKRQIHKIDNEITTATEWR